jgi:uncharacterized protein (DUF433 family)
VPDLTRIKLDPKVVGGKPCMRVFEIPLVQSSASKGGRYSISSDRDATGARAGVEGTRITVELIVDSKASFRRETLPACLQMDERPNAPEVLRAATISAAWLRSATWTAFLSFRADCRGYFNGS